MLRKWRVGGSNKYDYKPYLWGLWNRKVIIEEGRESDSDTGVRIATALTVMAISTVVGLITLFNF